MPETIQLDEIVAPDVVEAMTKALYENQRIVPGQPPIKAPEPEQKDEPKKVEPEVKAKEDAVPATKPEKKGWDYQRQQSDQANANERKRLEGEINALKTAMAAQQAQAATQAAQEQADGSAAAIDELLESLTNEETSSADIAKAIRKMRAIDAAVPKPVTDNSAVLDQIAELNARLDAADAARESAESVAALDKILVELNGKYDGKYQSDAVGVVQEQLHELGLDGDNLPHTDHVRMMLEKAYQDMFAADPANKGKKPKKVTVPVDTGRGGNSIPTQSPHGDLDSVADEMKRSGRF